MIFKKRQTQYQGKMKLIKVDRDNNQLSNQDPVYVNILRDEGNIIEEGTPITIENLNKGNWRDDKSISFVQLDTNDLPNAKETETQIVTTADGETWILPPGINSEPFQLGKAQGQLTQQQLQNIADVPNKVSNTNTVTVNGNTQQLGNNPNFSLQIPTAPTAFEGFPSENGGIGAPGTSSQFAKGDHRHPSDITKANNANTITVNGIKQQLGNNPNFSIQIPCVPDVLNNMEFVAKKGEDIVSENNTSWWRVWKVCDNNGVTSYSWIEQGGYLTNSTGNPANISLPKEMANTDYTLIASQGNRKGVANNGLWSSYRSANVYRTKVIQIRMSSTGDACWWYVAGVPHPENKYEEE